MLATMRIPASTESKIAGAWIGYPQVLYVGGSGVTKRDQQLVVIAQL